MKKRVLFFGIGLFLLYSLSGQESTLSAESPAAGTEIETEHYRFTVDRGAESAAESLSEEMELRFDVYNALFRFDSSRLPEKMRVRVFIDQDAYGSYIYAKTGQSRGGALYLHYQQRENRELVVCRYSRDEASMLPHQAFIQYLRGFVSNPPSWVREGFAIYFNTLKFDPVEKSLSYEENLDWLEDVKKSKGNAEPLRQLVSSDSAVLPYPEDLQIRSWALVSFFLNSGREDYFRTLTECFLLLSPAGSAAANSEAIVKRIDEWHGVDTVEKDYRAYLELRRTFNELVEEGRKAYTAGDKMNAELSFLAALNQKPAHYAPYYYLGLIYYEEKNFDMADEYYRLSLDYGADEALVSYALGLNAASAGRNTDAIQWLTRAKEADEGRYGMRASELISRLE